MAIGALSLCACKGSSRNSNGGSSCRIGVQYLGGQDNTIQLGPGQSVTIHGGQIFKGGRGKAALSQIRIVQSPSPFTVFRRGFNFIVSAPSTMPQSFAGTSGTLGLEASNRCFQGSTPATANFTFILVPQAPPIAIGSQIAPPRSPRGSIIPGVSFAPPTLTASAAPAPSPDDDGGNPVHASTN